MNDYPEKVKDKLNSILAEMANRYWLFVTNPGSDFIRQNVGKLSFENTIRFILSMGKGTTSDELMDFFSMDPDLIPSQSAFMQRRNQLSEYTFQYLFNEFSASFPQTTHQFKGKCVLAVDGTHVVYSTNEQYIEDYNKPRMADHKGYNHMHLNGFVDVISKTFLDVVIQPGQKPDERKAFHDMIDHFKPDDPGSYIVTADRGYESYDMMFHCENKQLFYVFRMKAPSSPKSILSTFSNELPDDQEEFDVRVRRFVTDCSNNVMKEQAQVYQYIHPDRQSQFFRDFLISNHIGLLDFRVLKIKTSDDTYEYIITNLTSDFDLNDIKEIYHLRWGIEVTFRYLKHAAGLLYFHSRKQEFLKQEIYATLILYNFGALIANEAAKENKRQQRTPDNKYQYEIDFSTAIRASRKYFNLKQGDKAFDIIRLLCRFVHAVKDKFRIFPRPLRGIGAIRFTYR